MTDQIKQDGGFGSTNTQNITINNTPNLQKAPSIVAKLVQVLAEVSSNESNSSEIIPDNFNTYDISKKIEHNEVVKYRQLIESYAEYMIIVENGYESVSSVTTRARGLVLKIIHHEYRKVVGDILKNSSDKDSTNIDVIRSNSDGIIESVINKICLKCNESCDESIFSEEIDIYVSYIVFHAFVECKVLEKPPL